MDGKVRLRLREEEKVRAFSRKALVIGIVLMLFGVSFFVLGCGDGAGEKAPEQPQDEAPEGEAGRSGGEGPVLLIIAPDDFQDREYSATRSVLEKAGCQVRVASSAGGICLGMSGMEVQPDLALEEVDVGDYTAVAFIGGGGAAAYFEDPAALDIARQAYQRDMTVGAICIAPVILAMAGILGGKKATVSPSGVNDLEQAGAEYTGSDVEQDGKIVTACGPRAAEAFGQALVDNINR